jgi:hypothetical protein
MTENPLSGDEIRLKAFELVLRASRDETFARRAKADPLGTLRENGIPEDALIESHSGGVHGYQLRGDQEMEWLPPIWWTTCKDFTCWSSRCPATCFVTFFT